MDVAHRPTVNDAADRLQRRVEDLRRARDVRDDAARSTAPAADRIIDLRRRRADAAATRLAAVVDGELVTSPAGRIVRIDPRPVRLPVARENLARLPGHPPPDVPLVCLDTETTGLGTATGTLAFLVGLGWWEGPWFQQAQLLLPDQPDEPALLGALRALLPANGWLVTYNGRGFDWPLLVTRFRLGLDGPPELAGHLDLLPVVRALFRHRMSDARLRTVEAELLGLGRIGDVDGREIPARYLGFLRDGEPGGLAEVVRHNNEDVRSLARLLVLLADGLAGPQTRSAAHPGDLAGLARLLAREGRSDEALECLDLAVDGLATRGAAGMPAPVAGGRSGVGQLPWWSPRVRADIGGPPVMRDPPAGPERLDSRWTAERIERERARLLRRAGRIDDALAAWRSIALAGGRVGALAWVEVAKLEEHLRHDLGAALRAVERASAAAARLRAVGLPVRGLDADLSRRRVRLARRMSRRSLPAVGARC
jgi:RNase_H superfamily